MLVGRICRAERTTNSGYKSRQVCSTQPPFNRSSAHLQPSQTLLAAMGSIGDDVKTTNGAPHTPFVQPPNEVAVSPNDANSVPSILGSIQTLEKNFSISQNDKARQHLLAEARHLVRSLETPRETMIKHCWAQVSLAPPQTIRFTNSTFTSPLHTWLLL